MNKAQEKVMKYAKALLLKERDKWEAGFNNEYYHADEIVAQLEKLWKSE